MNRNQPAEYKSHSVKDLFLAFGTILFAFGGASTFPTIQNDMLNRNDFYKSVRIAFTGIFHISNYDTVCITLLLFLVFWNCCSYDQKLVSDSCENIIIIICCICFSYLVVVSTNSNAGLYGLWWSINAQCYKFISPFSINSVSKSIYGFSLDTRIYYNN